MSCDHTKPCCKQPSSPRELPRAEFSVDAVQNLLTALQAGAASNLPELVRFVSELLEENIRMRRALRPQGPEVRTDAALLTFTFGPQNQYTFNLPIQDEAQRRNFAQQLTAAARELLARPSKPLPNQMPLPFVE
jgi:hypothetical protein